jgi:hypothetical protein
MLFLNRRCVKSLIFCYYEGRSPKLKINALLRFVLNNGISDFTPPLN